MTAVDFKARRHILQLLTAAPALAAAATPWPADGRHRYFSAPDGIRWATADGRHGGLLLPLGLSFALMPGSLAPDAGHLAYAALDRRTGSGIWTVPLQLQDGMPVAGQPAAFFHGGTFDIDPVFTADGRRITYAACAAGRWSRQSRRFDV